MKIAFLSFYSGKIDRGVEVATENLAKGLAQNHAVTVFQAGPVKKNSSYHVVILPVEKKWPTDTSSSPLRFFYLDYYSRKIILFTRHFIPYFVKEKYDVVIPLNGGWQVVWIRILTFFVGKKMLVQGNAGRGRDDLWQLFCLPNLYVAISPQGFLWARRMAPWVKSIFIPHGVDLALIEKSPPARVSFENPVILCVAAFLSYKRIDLLIQALQFYPEANLLLIGQGPLEKELQEMGERLLGKRFQLLTGVSHEQLIGYYKTADAFSLPSAETEALGIVYIEAMAAGLTVVAPDDKNRRAIIGDGGYFVDVTKPEAYAQMLQKAITQPKKQAAYVQATKYSWDQIVLRYEEELAKLQ